MNINNFLIQSKQSKKEIIFWGIFLFIIGHVILLGVDYLNDEFGPKPNIISNIVIYNDVNVTHSRYYIEKNSSSLLMYYLGNDMSAATVFNTSDDLKIYEFGHIIFPLYRPNGSTYSFVITNTGNKKANKVVLDIKMSSIPEFVFDNPKMTKKECGGHLGSSGCYIVFENINEGEEINFALSTKEYSDVIIISCMVDDKYFCDVRFLKVSAQIIDPKKLTINGTIVDFPTLENYSPGDQFYFDNNKLTFIKIESKTEYIPNQDN